MRVGFGERVIFFEVVGTEVVLPNRRRGIAGVARAGPIVFLKDFVGDLPDLELFGCFGVSFWHC